MARVGPQRHRKKNALIKVKLFWLVKGQDTSRQTKRLTFSALPLLYIINLAVYISADLCLELH